MGDNRMFDVTGTSDKIRIFKKENDMKAKIKNYLSQLGFDEYHTKIGVPGDDIDLAILICENTNGGSMLHIEIGKSAGDSWYVADDLGFHGPLKHRIVHCYLPIFTKNEDLSINVCPQAYKANGEGNA